MYKSLFDLHNKPLDSTKNSIRRQKSKQVGQQVRKVYEDYCNANTLKKQVRELWKLIKVAHNNPAAQKFLTQVLQIPYIPGPFSVNGLPGPLLRHNQKLGNTNEETTQLQFLFDYLRNTREIYICWIIYFSEDLNVLTVKLLKEDQLQDYEDLFNPNINIIGMFVSRPQPQVFTKTLSPNEILQYYSPETEICKKHVKSTPNNSTQASWKMMVARSQSKGNILKPKNGKFKFRSLSPKVDIVRCLFNKQMQPREKSKVEKSISVMSRQTKSKSNINLLSSVNVKPRLAATMFPKHFSRNQQVKKGLRKECKFNRIQKVYKNEI